MSFNLLVARVNKGMTQRALAKQIGVPRNAIAELERGGRAHLANAKKIADYFEVQVIDLMPVERDKSTSDKAA